MAKPMNNDGRKELNARIRRALEIGQPDVVTTFLRPYFVEGDVMGHEYALEFYNEFKRLMDTVHAVRNEVFSFSKIESLQGELENIAEILAHHFGGNPNDYCVDVD